MEELIQLTDSQLSELQEKSLEIAKYVVKFCEERDLRVYLYAGSMLGAIREKGFIPWDDDIDLIMPAQDYKRFKDMWDREADTDRYSLCVQSRTYNDHTLSDSVRDNYTTFITDSTVNEDVNQGLAVDIGPIHAAPHSQLGQTVQLICAAGCSLFKAGRVPARQKSGISFAARVILSVCRPKGLRYFFWHTFEDIASRPDKFWDKAEYVREFSMFPFITWLFPREWFDKAVYVPFEDVDMPVPVGYDGYLTKRYGDYMTPPAEKDRHPEHRIVFLDLNTPFSAYRGVKYYIHKS